MFEELPFEPMRFMDDPHRQTIVSAFCNVLNEPVSTQKIVQLSDGDQIALEITTPAGWREENPTLILIHGLCGSHRSPNVVRMVDRMSARGIRSVRFNMRGCGSGKGLAKKVYHSGRSDDLFEAVRILKKEHPKSPITILGFSLGANLTLKLAGELGEMGFQFIDSIIAICPPADLMASVRMVSEKSNEMDEKYFYKLMREEVLYRHGKFKDLPKIELPRQMRIYEFDQHYVAPYSGFANADDYYNRCSASNFAEEIRLPAKVLFSMDDPIISPFSLDGCKLHSNVRVYKTQKGGHMGYLTNPSKGKSRFWVDDLLEGWIAEFHPGFRTAS